MKFNRPFSGIPRIFTATQGTYIVAIQNITRTNCQIAVYSPTTFAGYVSASSGGSNNKSVSIINGFEFVSVPVDILIVYDGGITP